MAGDILKDNYEYVLANKKDLLAEHAGKFLLVHNRKMIGSFDTYDNAVQAGIDQFGMDAPFLVHEMLEVEPLNFVMAADFDSDLPL